MHKSHMTFSVVRKGSCLGGEINNFQVFVFRSKLEPEPHTKRRESTSEKASQNASQDSEDRPAAEELPGRNQIKVVLCASSF